MATNNTQRKSTAQKDVGASSPEEKRSGSNNKENESPIIVKEIDATQFVTVRNGFQGRLVYKSARTGELFVWDAFGAEQEMELRELRYAKNSAKKFFENNWFMFDENWIVDYLGVGRFYKCAIGIDEFDDIFQQTPAKIKETIGKMSKGQKKSAAYRARQLVAEGVIDSHKAINAIEESLGIELIER